MSDPANDEGLREVRGFGLTDPIPVAPISRYAGAAADGQLPLEVESALFNGPWIIRCPLIRGMERPVGDCRACPHFDGLGQVEVHGEATTDRRYRVLCNHAMPRPLASSAVSVSKEYRDKMIEAIEDRGGVHMEVERTLFAQEDAGVMVNCPLSRSKTGVWRLNRPPCPACEHYQGVVPGERGGWRALCAHRRALQFGRVASGEALFKV